MGSYVELIGLYLKMSQNLPILSIYPNFIFCSAKNSRFRQKLTIANFRRKVYRNLQFSSDLAQIWYGASLWAFTKTLCGNFLFSHFLPYFWGTGVEKWQFLPIFANFRHFLLAFGLVKSEKIKISKFPA